MRTLYELERDVHYEGNETLGKTEDYQLILNRLEENLSDYNKLLDVSPVRRLSRGSLSIQINCNFGYDYYIYAIDLDSTGWKQLRELTDHEYNLVERLLEELCS